MSLKSYIKTFLGDLSTPVGIYLRIRDLYPESCLLESGHDDEHFNGQDNSSTIVGINPIKTYRKDSRSSDPSKGDNTENAFEGLKEFYKSLVPVVNYINKPEKNYKSFNGLIGYISFNAIPHLENIKFSGTRQECRRIPEIQYSLYEYVIQVNHFSNILTITYSDLDNTSESEIVSKIDALYEVITNKTILVNEFSLNGAESSNMDDERHYKIIDKCKEHIQRGDIFQIVTSRRYSQEFSGDDFEVYRALRSINPSPYLYYYDGGGFKLFGSSPEAQLKLKNGIASSFPIAGTYARTGDNTLDKKNADALMLDPKENAEHVMLVDLARNDLSRFCSEVKVPIFKEVQYYSHVTHLVSRVDGKVNDSSSPIDLLTSTYPAGTLSGAPKYRAMQIINELEPDSRENYAGAIGLIDFSGDLIHAIMIRSFLSKDNTLHYQAGAGIVSESDPSSEIQEVKNKLGALKKALLMAEGSL